jgi:hypothetical protein
MSSQPRLRVLAFEALRSHWVARALEHDIAAEDRTFDGAVRSLLDILHAHINFDRRHGRQPLSAFLSAPERYWRAFAIATPVSTLNLPGPSGGTVRIAVADEGSSRVLRTRSTIYLPVPTGSSELAFGRYRD